MKINDCFNVIIYELPSSIPKLELAYLFKLYTGVDEIWDMSSGIAFNAPSEIGQVLKDMSYPAGVKLRITQEFETLLNVDTMDEPLHVDKENHWLFHNFAVKMKITDDKIYKQVQELYFDELIK